MSLLGPKILYKTSDDPKQWFRWFDQTIFTVHLILVHSI